MAIEYNSIRRHPRNGCRNFAHLTILIAVPYIAGAVTSAIVTHHLEVGVLWHPTVPPQASELHP